MTESELKALLRAGEWNDAEFKEARRSVPKSAYETVSAFANTHGGWLVFGVARLLSDSLASITDSLDGTLKHRTEAIDDTIQNLDDRIADTQRRVEQYRTSLVRKFSALEGAMATLQSQGNFLSSQLAGLTSNS